MELVYRYYEPDQGLEAQQAQIYKKVSGLPADAGEIERRFKGEKRDPKSARYVLTEDGKLLAYVQTSLWPIRPGTFILSYPWALPECPLEAQEKIFDELLTWLKNTVHPNEIVGEVVLNTPTTDDRIQFYKRKGFIEKERIYTSSINLDLSEVSKWEMNEELLSYSTQLATRNDHDQILEVFQADLFIRDVFPSKEEARYFLQNSVPEDSPSILILKNNQIVSAGFASRQKVKGSNSQEDEKEVITILSATRPEHPQAWKRLLIEISKKCLENNWGNLPIRISSIFFAYSMNAVHIAELNKDITASAVILSYKDEF
ncbi:hypothetical protein [Candidatus Hodarchaeum mangrovi]